MFENWVFHDVNPVFLQLESKLKCSILSGKLSAGTELPSIRRAAEMLNISSNTVSKAYSYMCREGLVQHTKHGRFTVIYDRVLIKKARTGAAKSLCYAYYFGMNDLGYTKQESDIIIQNFSVKISIPLENTGVSSVFVTSVWPFSLIFSLARRNEGNFFQAVPTTLSSSLAEVRLASLVAWA